MKVGEIWEFFNGSTEEVRTYRLEHLTDLSKEGPRARLERLGDDGEPIEREDGGPSRIAQVQVGTLYRGADKPGPTGSHWRKVADASVPEFEKATAAA